MTSDNHQPLSNLPFNHLDASFFNAAIYELAHDPLNFNINRLQSLLFNPIEHLTTSHFFSRSLDPEYNSSFSLLHLNIRSLLRKFKIVLTKIYRLFSNIGISENWLISIEQRTKKYKSHMSYFSSTLNFLDNFLQMYFLSFDP